MIDILFVEKAPLLSFAKSWIGLDGSEYPGFDQAKAPVLPDRLRINVIPATAF